MRPKGNERWIVCRICLQQPKSGLQSIFHHDDGDDLTQMILECGGVPIKKYDHYPDKICCKCLKYLKAAYKFRITCQRSHKHLSRFIAPVVVDPEEQLVAVVDDEVVELELKVEPNDVKQEVEECNEIEDVFNALDDNSSDIFKGENYNQQTDDAEYLDEVENEICDTDDEEYLPSKDPSRKRAKRKMNSKVRKRITIKRERNKKITKLPRAHKEKSFICDICGNIYPTQGRLNEHIKLHKGIKPYDCEICGHAFAQTQQLSRHMNTHTGNRPYKCAYCPAAFADLSTRNKHHRIHTNERPYVCDVCGKAFTYTNTLKIHKMIHTGEKPHVCEICGKGFPQAYKLRNHKGTHLKKNLHDAKILVAHMDSDDEATHAAIHLLEM